MYRQHSSASFYVFLIQPAGGISFSDKGGAGRQSAGLKLSQQIETNSFALASKKNISSLQHEEIYFLDSCPDLAEVAPGFSLKVPHTSFLLFF